MPDPIYIATIEDTNHRLSTRGILQPDPPVLDPAAPITEAFALLGVGVPDELVPYLVALPVSISATLVTVANTALRRRIPASFAWIAGYDYEVTVAQADRSAGSAITVIVRAPSPSSDASATSA